MTSHPKDLSDDLIMAIKEMCIRDSIKAVVYVFLVGSAIKRNLYYRVKVEALSLIHI